MRRMFTVLLTILAVSAQSQQQDSLLIRSIADEILTNGKAYEHLRVLTKTIGGRLSGSPQMYKAEAWGRKALEDARADKVWLQECMVPHWVRGEKEVAWVLEGNQKKLTLDVLALGNSVGTGRAGVKAPVVLLQSLDELEQRKNEVKGKIVFFNYKFNPKFINAFDAYGDAFAYRVFGPARAAKYGAAAVMIRSMTHSAHNLPHTGVTVYNDSFPKIPAVAMGLEDADKLAGLFTGNKTVNVFLRTNAQMLPDTIAHNVIGELRGTEFPEQIITVGGHLDSWDPAEGAHDDGAGCVQSIEVLRVLKAIGYKPKRTIRAVLFANEENGLRGGEKYAAEAKAKGEQHYFALESDQGGFTPRGFTFALSKEQMAKVRSWAPLLLPYGVHQWVEGGGGADIGPLNETFKTPIAEILPDSQRYFDIHHARSDVFEAVNKRELELGAINMAALIYLIDKYGL